ncbi:AraC family transcriptional regulator [Scandinavium sp. H11S7]|uniref:AraC family transcriptional regulator n=1 Tax=Scandinavium hiltneri TaxID=2926519 RepID=UPI002166B89C|nr:AraC family transcriptional regulator [Scandinavium hiltneri]MCS2156406.1 AraC family transcriptional regulator [Scandinavium hiltneri]
MSLKNKEQTHFHRIDALGGIDMLQARYYKQRFARHVHDTFCIGVIDQGAQRFYRSGAEHVAPRGDIIIVNADDVHTGSSELEHGWAYRAIYPPPDMLNNILRQVPDGKDFIPWFPDAVIHDPGLSEQLLLTFSMLDKEGNNLLKETLLLSSLTLLSVRYSRTRKAPPELPAATQRILRAKDFMDSCPEEEHTLTRLAELAGLSHWHFLRQFKVLTGMTPHAYLIQARLRKARTLLHQGLTILDTSIICGFTDQSHFHRHFKNSIGLTPGEFIKA